jgi:hypothetical protein
VASVLNCTAGDQPLLPALPQQRCAQAVLDGMGMAASTGANLQLPFQCRIALDKQGLLTVRMPMTAIGTGSCSMRTQIAAPYCLRVRQRPGQGPRLTLGVWRTLPAHGARAPQAAPVRAC